MTHRSRTLAVLLAAVIAGPLLACNIPVFRYALERWRPDQSEVIVFYQENLTAEDRRLIEGLQAAASLANVDISLADVGQPDTKEHAALWDELQTDPQVKLPYVSVRLPHPRGPLVAWHGGLADAAGATLFQSPARRELGRRLLAGDSIVWVLLKSSREDRNAETLQLVRENLKVLESRVQLPEGIGLPGSELYSEVPLLLKFSILELDPRDPGEQFLAELFRGFQPGAVQRDEPLWIPVFGRGRALEVIPADTVDGRLIEDLTAFLCGACSCQVKDQNPGFDLLLSADWDSKLFGSGNPLPPPAKSVGEGDLAPALLTIPPGRR